MRLHRPPWPPPSGRSRRLLCLSRLLIVMPLPGGGGTKNLDLLACFTAFLQLWTCWLLHRTLQLWACWPASPRAAALGIACFTTRAAVLPFVAWLGAFPIDMAPDARCCRAAAADCSLAAALAFPLSGSQNHGNERKNAQCIGDLLRVF